MQFIKTEIPDVILIKPTIFKDHRGLFSEYYQIKKFEEGGITSKFVQDNFVKSIKNTLRGMHFQEKYPQAKLLKCIKGTIFDVAIDIRPKSPYYKQWVAKELSEENMYQLYVPEWFAHGYYVISDNAVVTYKCSELYYPEHEKIIRWDDPSFNIDWPTDFPLLSKKDSEALCI